MFVSYLDGSTGWLSLSGVRRYELGCETQGERDEYWNGILLSGILAIFYQGSEGDPGQITETFREVTREAARVIFRRNGKEPPDALLAEESARWDTFKRDKFIYEQRESGLGLKKILELLDSHKEWKSLESEAGLRGAADRYAEQMGLPASTRRKPGRRKGVL